MSSHSPTVALRPDLCHSHAASNKEGEHAAPLNTKAQDTGRLQPLTKRCLCHQGPSAPDRTPH